MAGEIVKVRKMVEARLKLEYDPRDMDLNGAVITTVTMVRLVVEAGANIQTVQGRAEQTDDWKMEIIVTGEDKS